MGKEIAAGIQNVQAHVRNRWDDGSVKFAIVSGLTMFESGAPQTLEFLAAERVEEESVVGEPEDLDVTLAFSGGVSGTYELISCLGLPIQEWAKNSPAKVREFLGPIMSEFHYYLPTSDEHLAIWFYLRRYANGQSEVETVVENGWLNVTAPGQRDYQVSVRVGGSERFSGALTHYHHTRWSRVDWIGTDPQIIPRHNPDYLRASRLVPNYGYAPPSPEAFSRLASDTNPSPFALGDWSASMADTGYQAAIGILPRWEALYCTSGDPRAFLSSISNQRGSGRWPIHYRDETTGRVPSYRSYPNLTLTSGWGREPPAPTGGANGKWDIPHHPSNGFLPYLLEGRWSSLESIQFSAAVAVLESNPVTRQGGGVLACINAPLTTRGVAWAWRTVAQAAAASPTEHGGEPMPDADAALQTAFTDSIAETAEWARKRYVDGTVDGGVHKNDIGWLGQYDAYARGQQWWGGSWMVQYQSLALGYASDLEIEGLPNPEDLRAIRDHSYIHCLSQLGDDASWNFRRGAVYDRPYLKNSSSPQSPVFMTVGESFLVYRATKSLSELTSNIGDTLKRHGSDMDMGADSSNEVTGYWSYTMAALAMAVDHGAPGAWAKYQQVTAAPNYQPAEKGARNNPGWMIVPRNL